MVVIAENLFTYNYLIIDLPDLNTICSIQKETKSKKNHEKLCRMNTKIVFFYIKTPEYIFTIHKKKEYNNNTKTKSNVIILKIKMMNTCDDLVKTESCTEEKDFFFISFSQSISV